jgi:hypothetical protein
MAEFSMFGPGEHAALADRFASSKGLRAEACRQRYLIDFLRCGPDAFMHNGRGTRAHVAIVGEAVVPVVVNDGDVDDCYLVSPRGHYILYMIEEMQKIEPRWLSSTIQNSLKVIGAAITAGGFNRHASINNWLLTTAPVNPLTVDELRALTHGLKSAFPTHALVYRGIDPRDTAAWSELSRCGYEFVMNRPVHEWDPVRISKMTSHQRKDVRSDLRLLTQGPLRVREPAVLSKSESERVEFCYLALYVGKYSTLNAQFTAEYFRRAVASGFVKVALFERKDTDEIAGFLTWFSDHGRIVSSLVGYDSALPLRAFPVYRMSFAFAADACIKLNQKLFLSTGVASFKFNRGTYEWMEYEGFYVRHLPRYRRASWRTLATLINFAGTHLDSSQI